MVTMCTFMSTSISKNISLVIVYKCAKFGAFIKYTIFLVSRYTIKVSFTIFVEVSSSIDLPLDEMSRVKL